MLYVLLKLATLHCNCRMNIIRFLVIPLAFATFAANAWSSTSVINAIKAAALSEYETGLTKQQQEDSKWLAEYFKALPSDIYNWHGFKFELQGAPRDLVDIQTAFLLAYSKNYLAPRSAETNQAIIKYSSPIFWRVREISSVAPEIAATLVFQFIDVLANSPSATDMDIELAGQIVETTLLNYKNLDSQLLLAIIDTHLVLEKRDPGILSKRILREKLLTEPSLFKFLIIPSYSNLKNYNEADGLSFLSNKDINTLEVALLQTDPISSAYDYRVLNHSLLRDALRPEDWASYPNFDTFLVKHFSDSKK